MNAPPLALRPGHCLADLLRAFALSRDLLDDGDVRQFLIEKGRMTAMNRAENAAREVTRPREPAEADSPPRPEPASAHAYGRVNSYTKRGDATGDAATVQLGFHQVMEGDVDLRHLRVWRRITGEPMKTLLVSMTMEGLVRPLTVSLPIKQDAGDDHDNLLNAQRKIALLVEEMYRRCEGREEGTPPGRPIPGRRGNFEVDGAGAVYNLNGDVLGEFDGTEFVPSRYLLELPIRFHDEVREELRRWPTV